MVRALVGTVLVLLIVVIVVSPYVDLPLSTVGARPAAGSLLSTVAMAWAVVAGIWLGHGDQAQLCQHHLGPGATERGPLGLTGVLLC